MDNGVRDRAGGDPTTARTTTTDGTTTSATGRTSATDRAPATATGRTAATARVVTDAFQPRNTLPAGMLGIGLAAAGDRTGLPWGLLAALCAGLIPAGYIEWERKRGTWDDRHVLDRTKRAPVFFVILGSIGTGSAIMALGHAPTGILVTMLALWAMTVVILAVNTAWKISVDSAVASAVVALLAAVHSPWWLSAYALTVAVCWSRVALGHHTVAQTVAGASLGAATATAFLFV